MLLQTNSYTVPPDRRAEHARLMRHFKQVLARLGCEQFEVYEQVAPSFLPLKGTVRFVQIMRFRDREHYHAVQAAERDDPAAQELIRQFSELIGLEQQREQSLFAVGYYAGLLSAGSAVVAEKADDGESHLAGLAPHEAVEAPPGLESRDFTVADLEPRPPEPPSPGA